MSLPSVVTVPFYDPSCKSGVARVLSVANGGATVVLKFVIGGGRACAIPVERLCANDREAVALWAASHCAAETQLPWTPFEQNASTWSRLLRYGEVCKSGQALSAVGMRALWAVVLSDKANRWLDGSTDLPLRKLLSCFVGVWWHYCCACAHTEVNSLSPRQRVFVLELMCHSIQKRGSRHACVFSALLMQIVLLFCHDQSVCCAGANLDDVGYNHKVDCAKIGPVVKFSALLRHASRAKCAESAVAKVRDPRRRIVWLLRKPSLKFKRLRKLNLLKFRRSDGSQERLEAKTNKIKYWNEDEENYVYAPDFHTSLDAVEFKRCGDQLQLGDVWLESGSEEWTVVDVKPMDFTSKPAPVWVSLRRGELTKRVCCPFARTVPVGSLKQCEGAVAFLRDNPDVVDGMSLSTGPPLEHSRKIRLRPKLCNLKCRREPIQSSSWEEYLLWRCAVSTAVSSMDERSARVAAPYTKTAKFSWLVV